MKKREAKFQTEFNQWLRDNPQTGAFELKQTTTDSLPFSNVQEHQINALLAVKHGRLIYKIPDDSRSYKPFDCFCFTKSSSYIVIKYPSCWVMIDIDEFQKENASSARRSLLVSRAREIATIVV